MLRIFNLPTELYSDFINFYVLPEMVSFQTVYLFCLIYNNIFNLQIHRSSFMS